MNKPPFDPSQPFQAAEKPPFDPNQPFQAADIKQPLPYGVKDMIGDVGRPLLEAGGAVAGGLAGAPLGPVGAAGGGALGFGAGKAAADLLDRGLGRKPFLKNVPEAVSETGRNAMAGMAAESTGLVASKAIPPILGAAGNLRNKLGEWATAIPEKNFKSVARNPMSMRPGLMEKAGDNFESSMANAGISKEITPEFIDRMRNPGQYAFDTFKKLKTTGSITPQEALHARQSLDAIYPVPNNKNGSYIKMLDDIRDELQAAISKASPELQAASKDYAIAKSAQRFKSIFPQTNSGKPAYFRSGAIIAGLAAGRPEAMFGVPAVAGTVTAATGAAGSVAKKILSTPAARRTAASILGRKLFESEPVSKTGVVDDSNAPPQELNGQGNTANQQDGVKDFSKEGLDHILTQSKAREYLKAANGNKDLARQMARKDGYSW